jgi:class 3 adenylate cyclase
MSDARAWLDSIGLGKYAEAFDANEVPLALVGELSDDDLREMGLPMGPRRTLLRAARQIAPAPCGAKTPSASSAATPVRGAERRQITVMFCDLVGSTALSERLDIEDMSALLRDYRNAAAAAVERYDGHVAQYLGDGLMTYFGWPSAHEDDAERAVHSALEILKAVKKVPAPAPLKVRIGIATGPVVVGESDTGDAAMPKLAVGETPNLASRVQGLAETDEIIIAEATRRLIGVTFDLDDRGDAELKGILDPVRVWKVRGENQSDKRVGGGQSEQSPDLVGRQAEIALLLDRWLLALDGEGQVVEISGEAGIGKSRLIEELLEGIGDEPHFRLRFQSSPYHANSAFYPLIRQVERAAGFALDDSDTSKLDKLEALLSQGTSSYRHTAALLSPLLNFETGERYPALGLSPQRHKAEIMEAMADYLAGLSEVRPLLVIVEDAHWIDPSSEDAIDQVVSRIATKRVLALITHRPEYRSRWSGLGHATALHLGRLGRRHVASMARQISGDRVLPDAVVERIAERTDGVPLFVEELTRTVIESHAIAGSGDTAEFATPLNEVAVPATLRDSLTARLDRLPAVRDVAQIGACIGRSFSRELLAEVSEIPSDELDAALDELTQSGLVSRTGTTETLGYRFKHALVQDAARDLLLKTRRQAIHRRIGEILERDDTGLVQKAPEVLARHFAEAGLDDRAIEFWRSAGTVGMARFAYVETIEHLTVGLSRLEAIPEGRERDEVELSMQLPLGAAYLQSRGFGRPEVETAYARSLRLAELLGDDRRKFIALYGMSVWQMVRGEPRKSKAIADRLLDVARQTQVPPFQVAADLLYAILIMSMGDNLGARDYFERVLDKVGSIDPATVINLAGGDPECYVQFWLGMLYWKIGYPDRAATFFRKGVERADAVDHPTSRAAARCLGSHTILERGEFVEAAALAREGVKIAKEQGLPDWQAIGLGTLGNALLGLREISEAEETLRLCEDMRNKLGNDLTQTRLYIGRVHLIKNEPREALAIMDETLPRTRASGELWFEAEFVHLRGQALAASGDDNATEAEETFLEAISIASSQGAKSYELRAATSLAEFWRRQGRAQEARDLLAPIYHWFTEGFGTRDLVEAKSLLDTLEGAE